MRATLHILRSFFVYFILCIATFLMLRIIIDYSSFRPDTRFLQYKQDYIHNKVWTAAFYVHVFTSILALMAGITLRTWKIVLFNAFHPDPLTLYIIAALLPLFTIRR